MTKNRTDTCPICNGSHWIHKHTCIDYITDTPFDVLQCCDCGLYITQNTPVLNDKTRYYPKSDSILHPENTRGAINRAYRMFSPFWQKQKARIVEQQSRRASGVLLDIGCKTGEFVNTMRRRGWIAHGLEYNPYAREYGNTHYNLKIEDQQKLLHIHPKSYNVVTSWDSIGELQDLNKSFAAMCNLIVSDGTLIIAFSDASSPAAQHYKEQWFSWDVPRKIWHLTPKSFERLAAKHNMQIIRRKRYEKKSFGTNTMSEWLANGKKSQTSPLLKSTLHEITNRIKAIDSGYIVYTLKPLQNNGHS